MCCMHGGIMKIRINVTVDKDTLNEFDKVCGITSRSAYMRKMMSNEVERVNKLLTSDKSC